MDLPRRIVIYHGGGVSIVARGCHGTKPCLPKKRLLEGGSPRN